MKCVRNVEFGWMAGVLLAGCMAFAAGTPELQTAVSALEDMAAVTAVEPGREYRLGDAGVCGMVQADHIRVTRVEKNSPADDSVMVGDLVRAIQGKPLSADLLGTVRQQMGRLGRDEAGKLDLKVERPGTGGRPAGTFTLHLRLPPADGTLQQLGPTGVFGKFYRDHIVVDQVVAGSPADGTLRPGDRIVEFGGKALAGDLYALLAERIDAAESAAGGGTLTMKVRRLVQGSNAEETVDHSLSLLVLGSYSPTAPANCPKTDALIARAADAILRKGENGRLSIGLLGLLATGEKKYIEHVGQVLRQSDFARPDVKLALNTPMTGWPWSYQMLTMCEYYLLTGDAYVLPAIRTHALTIAQGQDVAGLWNHRMADPAANFGKLHGRLYGYAAINQTSIVLWMSLILAEKCGIDDPEVRAAITKTHALYRNWVGKGALPYGNHGPMEHILTNNGTSGSVAVGFALLGDVEGARFYAMLSAAAHEDILTGHTGPFFNIMWTGLGANVAGPEVVAALNRKLGWLRTLTRAWDGRFVHMEGRGGVFGYSGLSSTGAALLNLCAARRAICITGKGADTSLWLTGQAAENAVAAADTDDVPDRRALLAQLGSPLPKVRLQAAHQLASDNHAVADEVMRLLADGTRDQRIGATHAIGTLGLTEAADELMVIVRNETEELWLRQLAVGKLAEWECARSYGPELLAILVADKPYDTFGDFDRALGFALESLLAPDPYALGLDKDLFYRGVLKLLNHKHMWGRGAGMALIRNIPLEDFHRVADTMLAVIEDKDRTYTGYHGDGQRQAGLEILNRLNIKEAIDLTVGTINEPTGRVGPRVKGRVALLETFGAEAQYAIPKITEALGKQADDIVKGIQTSSKGRSMISLEEAKQAGLKDRAE